MNYANPPAHLTFDRYVTCGPEHGMLPDTKIRQFPVNYIQTGAGMGDYINQMPAFLWIAEHAPWICGTIFSCDFMIPFLQHHLKPYPHWRAQSGEHGTSIRNDICLIGPNMEIEGVNRYPQLVNPIHTHPIDLGFLHFANMMTPAGTLLPKMSFPRERLPHKLRVIRKKYVVFTPGVVTPSRMTSGRHWNPIIDYVIEKGLTPVFLGKDKVTATLHAKFADDINYDRGIDMRNQTTMMDAAAICDHSALVIGLDNGLLHLAATTSAPLVFGYNIAAPEHRRPRRNWSHVEEVNLTKAELACANCQSNVRQLHTHTFHNCLNWKQGEVSELQCVELMFADRGRKFREAIDRILAVRD